MTKTIQLHTTNLNEIFQHFQQQKNHLTPYINFKIAQQIIQNSVADYDQNLFFEQWKNYHLYSQIKQFNLITNYATSIRLYSNQEQIYGNIETTNETLYDLFEQILKYQFISTPTDVKTESTFLFEFHNGLFQLDNNFLELNWNKLIPSIAERTRTLANKLYFSRKIQELKGSDWARVKLVNCIQNIQNDTSNKAQQEKHNIITEATNRINQNITIKDLL